MTIRKNHIFAGLVFIALGIDFLVHPVRYSGRFAYDLRGWTKWIASFLTVFPGIYLIITASYKGRLKPHCCPKCGHTESLAAGEEFVCTLCKLPLEELNRPEETRGKSV